VDLSALAREIVADLKAQDPQRQVEFVITEGMAAEGDAHLLQLALENLIGNAWKFTGPRPQALIEFGVKLAHELPQSAIGNQQSAIGSQQSVYFVRDNGVGFDTAYADQLFAPFQRLHGMREFPGTGIGLATVQRIIHRHGGRVWAEAAVDQGATFCFTLGGA
jgi:signal transduction histidine kinase